MRERFSNLCRAISSAGDSLARAQIDRLFDELTGLMSQPHRAYHNLEHVAACLAQLDSVASTPEVALKNAIAIEAAIWYHDAIYNPKRADNEEQSADLACDRMTSIHADDDALNAVRALILATRHSVEVEPAASDADADDAKTMVDIDLSILGQCEENYNTYEAAIASEYAWVPRDQYVAGRTKVLQSFLDRPHIYATPYFHAKYEQQARVNLARAIEKLKVK